VERQLLDFRRARASADVARVLELKAGDPMVMIKRLLVFGGDPVVLEEVWLPGTLFKGLTASAVSEHRGALYNLFETAVRHANGAGRGTAQGGRGRRGRVPRAPGVAAGHPLLAVERVSYTYQTAGRDGGRGSTRPTATFTRANWVDGTIASNAAHTRAARAINLAAPAELSPAGVPLT
jgi:GntR family transcriptional regulator